MTELNPIRIMSAGISGLYFHDRETDIVYKLKDQTKHNNYNIFGLRKELHLTEDDIISNGKLKDVTDRSNLILVLPLNSYKQ